MIYLIWQWCVTVYKAILQVKNHSFSPFPTFRRNEMHTLPHTSGMLMIVIDFSQVTGIKNIQIYINRIDNTSLCLPFHTFSLYYINKYMYVSYFGSSFSFWLFLSFSNEKCSSSWRVDVFIHYQNAQWGGAVDTKVAVRCAPIPFLCIELGAHSFWL